MHSLTSLNEKDSCPELNLTNIDDANILNQISSSAIKFEDMEVRERRGIVRRKRPSQVGLRK